jgi:Uma2 family endonuclease
MTSPPISLEEYLSTTYNSEREYIDGELVDRNIGEFDHSGVQGIVCRLLYTRRREAGIHVFPALHMQVSSTRCRVPDILVTTRKIAAGILREPPFLCIEILSPEDRAGRIEEKIDDYLAFGVPYVWVIDPRRQRAWSYTKEGRRETTAGVLTTGNPDLALKLSDVFAALREDIEIQ